MESAEEFRLAAELWEVLSTVDGIDRIRCEVSLVHCYFEQRKIRKAEGLLEDLLANYPKDPSVIEVAKRYDRYKAA
jgi:hypothetical protein